MTDRSHDCPRGCGTYQRLSRHWSGPNCTFPRLEPDQRETVEGLLLAGATIAGNGPNKHLVVGTVHEPLAEWLADSLGWLTHSVRERDGGGNRQLEYRVRTHAHETLTTYLEWTDGDRRPPEGYEPTAETARVWYALAGGLQWHGDYDSQRTATFSALEDSRAAWIVDTLEAAGFEPTRVGKRVQLRPTETDRFLAWIGDPAPGTEHKWCLEQCDRCESWCMPDDLHNHPDGPVGELWCPDCWEWADNQSRIKLWWDDEKEFIKVAVVGGLFYALVCVPILYYILMHIAEFVGI